MSSKYRNLRPRTISYRYMMMYLGPNIDLAVDTVSLSYGLQARSSRFKMSNCINNMSSIYTDRILERAFVRHAR